KDLARVLKRVIRQSTAENIQAPLRGVVYGSDLEENRIDIYFDALDRRLPCYYKPHRRKEFRRLTEDETSVEVTGKLWKMGPRGVLWKVEIDEVWRAA